MKGPYPIICRGHSGSRLLAEAFRLNGIWMGLAENAQRDAKEFNQGNRVVRRLVQEGYYYSQLPEAERGELRSLMRNLVEQSRNNCPDPEEKLAFGWKRPITIFTCEVFMETFPEAKVIHLVRDGRDVMLSRLNFRMHNLVNDPLHRLVVLGDPDVREYRGRPLTLDVIEEYRNEFEMHHWVTAVSFGMRARRYGDRYLEIRYEDLCEQPEETLSRVFDVLQLPFFDTTRDWVMAHASTRAIGKWRGREEELSEAIRIGEPLLRELGYL